MIDFHRLFINPFLDKQISLTEELRYGATQVDLLTAGNTGGAFDTIIADTTAALAGLEGGVSDTGLKLSLQKSRTLAKRGFRDSLPGQIAKVWGAVVAAYGEDDPNTLECFPEGRTIYTTCRDEQLNNKLDVLVAAITPKQAQVGATAVTLATALKTNWASLFGAQGTAMAQTELSGDARKAARLVLKVQLFKNLVTLALMFLGDTSKCDLYCPQHLLRNRQSSGAPEDATLEAGAYDAGTQKLTLTMHSPDADHFDLKRRNVGAPDYDIVAENVAANTNGTASFEDTIAPGDYEYVCVPKRNGVAGHNSDVLLVNAA